MTNSRYPKFHKYVTRVYIVVAIMIITVMLASSFVDNDEFPKSTIITVAGFLVFAYLVYWAIVRLNCYGPPNSQQHRRGDNNNQGMIYSQGNRSSTSMRSSSSPHETYQTYASYRFGAFSNRLRSFSSFASSQQRGNDNGEEESRNDNDTIDDQYMRDMEQVLSTPPPTYTKALQDAGSPPPYISKTSSLDGIITNVEDDNINRNVRPRSELLTQSRPTSFRTFTSSSSTDGGSAVQVPSQSYRPNSNSNALTIDMNHSPIITSSPPVRLIPPIPTGNNGELRPPTRPVPPVPEQNGSVMQETHLSQSLSWISTGLGRNSNSSIIINITDNRPSIPHSQTAADVSNTSPSTTPEQNAVTPSRNSALHE
ncbi:2550_t:CDS:2 [Acaulospora colombiana]|uniref:2550_t:CDS:1 n=1 Tax=Acaulospora colombiana TaxID=27376 RepID=A0ACA9L4S1_9GLOM|nr:2550_t:CDS:2 [Acaulospora colombiana]